MSLQKVQQEAGNLTLNGTNTFTMTCTVLVTGGGGPNDAIITSQYCDSFECNGTVTNITVDDSPTGEVIAINTGGSGNPRVGNVNNEQTNTITAYDAGTVFIRCNVIDLESGSCTGGCNSSDVFNITVVDNDAPGINLGNPVNDSWSSNSSVNFFYTPNDITSGIASCNLVVDDVLNQSNASAIVENQENNLTTTLPDGTYTWTVNCTDDSSNSNVGTNTSVKTINVDVTIPTNSFSGGTEANNTYFNRDWIFVNVTADDTNEANITFYLYNSTSNVNTTTLGAGNRSINFTNINSNDYYFYNVTITDKAGNTNNTETRRITLDNLSSQVIFAGGTESNNTYFSRDWIFVNVSVTETNEANITFYLYNSTANVNTTKLGSGARTVNWTNLPEEKYYYNVTVTDLASNSNSTSTRVITLDTTSPVLSLNLPTNNTNVSNQNLAFNFTANDTYSALLNCSIYIDTVLNLTNSSTSNTTLTNFDITNIREGLHEWNVSCIDNASNVGTSSVRNFRIDLSPPVVLNISFTPNSADDVDPDVLLNFTVNATDNVSIDFVILQYKSPSDTDFTNLTMSLNTGSNLYNASFTPNASGNWTYRVFINDTFGHSNTTSERNISVAFDYTWTRTPSLFDSLACIILTTCKLGNITVNNTGDFALNFDLSNTPSGITVSYNTTEPFSLSAKELKVVEASITAPETIAEYDVVITVDSTDVNADPDSSTTNITFSAFSGGPYFDLTIEAYPTTAIQSNSYNLSAKLRNIGNCSITFK